jgi:hypothetical protein
MSDSLDLVPATVDDFRRVAEKRLPRLLFDYVDGGAGAEVTMRQNVADFEALRLNQRVMVDVSKIDTSVELFGDKLAMPLVLAPVGLAGMMARRAEVQAKRSADAAGIPFCLSTVGICTMEEVARVSSKPLSTICCIRGGCGTSRSTADLTSSATSPSTSRRRPRPPTLRRGSAASSTPRSTGRTSSGCVDSGAATSC